MMRRNSRYAAVVLLLIAATAVRAQSPIRVPFQAPAFEVAYVQDEFIVVFDSAARGQIETSRDAIGRPIVNSPAVQALIDRFEVQRFDRQFPGMGPEPETSLRPDLTGHYKVRIPPGVDRELALEAFDALPQVDRVERIGIHPVFATPNDTYFDDPPAEFPYDQWHYRGTYGIRADQAWDEETGSSSVVVAILDSGVKFMHTDLGNNDPPGPLDPITSGNVWTNTGEIPGNDVDDDGNGFVDDVVGWDFVSDASGPGVTCLDLDCGETDNNPTDGNGHGTHVAGTVAAITNNGRAVAGVAGGYADGTPGGTANGVRLMCLRIGFHSRAFGVVSGVVRMDWAAEAMAYVAGQVDRGVNVTAVNCSWGSSDTGGLSAATDALLARDVMVVNAAGNSASSTAPFLSTKAGVVSVAATDSLGMEASFTNRGPWVDIAAPGVDIMSTYHNPDDPDTTNMYVALLSGTSMSAPHVCGVAALLESRDPSLTSQDKFDLMAASATPYVSTLELGAGIVNARGALDSLGIASGSITGSIVFSGIAGAPYPVAKVLLVQSGAGAVIDSTESDPATGVFLLTPVTDGLYDLEVQARCFLPEVVANVVVAGGVADVGAVNLSVGTSSFSSIQLAGSFTDPPFDLGSAPYLTEDSPCVWSGTLSLLPGTHEIQFVTDGLVGDPLDYGRSQEDTLMIPGGPFGVELTNVAENPIKLSVESAGEYGFQLDERYPHFDSELLTPVAVGEKVPAKPGVFKLQAFPNPARSRLHLSIQTPAEGAVGVSVVTPGGRVIRRISFLAGTAGTWHAQWDGRDERGTRVPTGVYFVQARWSESTATRKIVWVE